MWGLNCLAGMIDLRFLPITKQGLHSGALTVSSRCRYGHQQCVAIHIILQVPGWLECISTISASRSTFGIVSFSSRQTHPERTWRSLQFECIYGFNAFRRLSLFSGYSPWPPLELHPCLLVKRSTTNWKFSRRYVQTSEHVGLGWEGC